MKIHKSIFFIIIILQILVIVSLSYFFIVNFYKSPNFKKSIPPGDWEMITTPSGSLRFFYEPISNSVKKYRLEGVKGEIENEINNNTLKDRYDYSYEKEDNVFRIVTLGDSFTYGYNVSTNKIWPEILEDKLNKGKCKEDVKFEVINLGVAGYDIQYALERFNRRGSAYDPDLVVWMVLDNDFDYIEENVKEMMEIIRPIMEREGKRFDFTTNDVLDSGSLYKYVNELYTRSLDLFNKRYKNVNTINYQISKLGDIRGEFSGDVVIVGLAKNLVKSKNVNALSEFVKENKDFYFFKDESIDYRKDLLPDEHPGVDGHAVIAGDIYSYLEKKKLTPCN